MNIKFINIVFIFTLLMLPVRMPADTLYVDKSGPVRSISGALDAAKDNDVIIVKAGHYKENQITVDKPVKIVGRNYPVIDAEMKQTAFLIDSDSVTISGLTVKDVPTSYIEDWAAIRINAKDFCIIENNKLYNNFFGIYLKKADNCIVRNNTIIGEAKDEMSSGNAIHLWYSDKNIIIDNTVKNHRDGIYLEFVSNSRISENLSEDNIRYGLHYMFSDNNVYKNNTFRRNGAGVAVMFSENVEMTGNTFENNLGASSYGLLLKEIFDSKIHNNIFINNTTGIYAETATRVVIKNNDFKNNGWALKMLGSCRNSKVLENNFIANTFDLMTNTQKNYNTYKNNYWSKYTGYDLDEDGYGDVPYRPVKLFSYVSSKSKESLVLLRSLFVKIINFAEKVTPVFTPTTLKDEQPLMEPVKW